ncbi:DUF1801 domain-containing protein [Paludibaculum fermentans]|uniref:DUF1801 domain-containing protein n=1 Tax=Paludibaculum fermentans TaxID=1473598 RepID=A0A7S7SL24_PALFE|nr:DUF1801 domain-containing protein [Paludibaculum fermentans]QOY88358.1 DUF1801 domain-containing protein [Paludibaculum fermentans]
MKSNSAGPRSLKPKQAVDQSVESFLATLDHPRKPEILALRELILSADPNIREAIKWNAPSFYTTEHFATMNLRAKNGLGLILHFGAKKNAISKTGVPIPDPHSLLEWLAKDRALVTFRDLKDLDAKGDAFTNLLREWIRHL